ncbi:ImuA family protein [Roseivivax sp. THAF30]|jgi:protein ImuA|uniref:ImuA family protein n=1 Tax=Roseivivax sp. THAF30 TaxID=2587852 RepID=UPI00126984C0|nr:hypothetical protein [Roseivivax sp. THAF30]QFT62371.1 hypothetical protein FIU91_05470 [Roseivivax sp. THAF30]
MTDLLLSRKPLKAAPALTVAGDIALTEGRVHEACGLGRFAFAAFLARAAQGPVIWISGPGGSGMNPDGMAPFCDPGRFLFVTARRPIDRLWALEETLRAGAVALAVADLDEAPGLTPVRRLHLAAETGAEMRQRPTGLLLTPGEGGAAGVESRWHVSPDHAPSRARWTARRVRARMAPPAAFSLRHDETGLSAAPIPV